MLSKDVHVQECKHGSTSFATFMYVKASWSTSTTHWSWMGQKKLSVMISENVLWNHHLQVVDRYKMRSFEVIYISRCWVRTLLTILRSAKVSTGHFCPFPILSENNLGGCHIICWPNYLLIMKMSIQFFMVSCFKNLVF